MDSVAGVEMGRNCSWLPLTLCLCLTCVHTPTDRVLAMNPLMNCFSHWFWLWFSVLSNAMLFYSSSVAPEHRCSALPEWEFSTEQVRVSFMLSELQKVLVIVEVI